MTESGPPPASPVETKADDVVVGSLAECLLERGYADEAFIRQQLQQEPDVKSALSSLNSQGSPVMHTFLQVRWNGEEATRREAIALLLHHGADVDASDSRGCTALHVAVVGHNISKDELRLLARQSQNIDAVNNDGYTPLQLLLTSSESRNDDFLVVLLEAGATPDVSVRDHCSPLQTLLATSTDPKRHLNLVTSHAKQDCQRHIVTHLKDLLHYAITDCSAAALEALLDKYDVTRNQETCATDFVLEAAVADQDCEKKVELLVNHGLPPDGVNSCGMSLLHLGAMASSLRIMELASPFSADIQDSFGNTPLHYLNANERFSNHGNVFQCVKFLLSRNADIKAVNSKGESPVATALAANRKQVVRVLLSAGAAVPSVEMTEDLPLDRVTILTESDVITESKQPLVTTLQASGLIQRLANKQLDEEEYLEVSRRMEKLALAMTNSYNSSLTSLSEEVLFVAVENQQKEFIAAKKVQEFLEMMWYGRQQRSSAARTALAGFVCLFRLMIVPFLLLFYALPRYGRNYDSFTKSFLYDKCSPSARYCAMVITYIVFILLFVYDCAMITGLPVSIQADPGDYFLFIYVLGLMVHEVGEMVMRGVREHFSSWRNCLDIGLIVLFICHFVMRFVDWSGVWRPADGNVQLGPFLRLASMLYGLGAIIAILRFLAYLRPFKTIGPIQVAFKNILKETASFLVIWLIFLVAFAVAMTAVYSASVYGISDRECVQALANESDVASLPWKEQRQLRYRCARQIYNQVVPYVVKGLYRSFTSLFHASFGLIDVEDFNAATGVESTIGKLLLSLWLLTGVIVLVNLLVAIVTNAFQSVQDHSDVEWKFARAALLFDVMKSPIFVPPFNILYYFALLVVQGLTFRLQRHEGTLEVEVDAIEMGSLETSVSDENNRRGLLKFLQQVAEDEHNSNPTTVRDLQSLEEKMDATQQLLSAQWSAFCLSSVTVTCPHCHHLLPLRREEAKESRV